MDQTRIIADLPPVHYEGGFGGARLESVLIRAVARSGLTLGPLHTLLAVFLKPVAGWPGLTELNIVSPPAGASRVVASDTAQMILFHRLLLACRDLG